MKIHKCGYEGCYKDSQVYLVHDCGYKKVHECGQKGSRVWSRRFMSVVTRPVLSLLLVKILGISSLTTNLKTEILWSLTLLMQLYVLLCMCCYVCLLEC